ncbi:hypothetical protein F4604DRAFT_1687795 [Suillus subluteus]|nr:hypothetical protein F4604DRAFT_1687795 [Suillus subluteus]
MPQVPRARAYSPKKPPAYPPTHDHDNTWSSTSVAAHPAETNIWWTGVNIMIAGVKPLKELWTLEQSQTYNSKAPPRELCLRRSSKASYEPRAARTSRSSVRPFAPKLSVARTSRSSVRPFAPKLSQMHVNASLSDALGSEAAGRAIQAVLNRCFPPLEVPTGPGACIQDVTTREMSLDQVALLRHESNEEDQNRDPDVEELMRDEARDAPTLDPPCMSVAYVKTGPMKRSFANQFPGHTTSAKKIKLEGSANPSSITTPSECAHAEPRAAPMRTKSQAKVRRDARRRALQLHSRARKAEELRSSGSLDARTFRTSSTGWQGTNYGSTKDGRELRAQWEDYSILLQLKGFDRVPYLGLKTRIRDSLGRLWLLRTFIGERIEALLPAFEKQVAAFRLRWRGVQEDPIGVAYVGTTGILKITIMNCVFQAEFPLLAKRYSDCAQTLGISPLYGYFFNFCLNSARAGVKRVHCSPHVDWKNIAIGVCVIFIYVLISANLGKFNSKERSWLVVWEAGLILEMPAGVFIMYPSSLFFHFNVDMCDLELVCTDGRLPTPENSYLLDGGDGRGSCVWFNQASMFQTAELGFATIAQARAAGAPCNSDPHSLISRGLFPVA